MNPDSLQPNVGGSGGQDPRDTSVQPTPTLQTTPAQREAAANIVRHEIDDLYGGQPTTPQQSQGLPRQMAAAASQPLQTGQPQDEDINPYDRTHQEGMREPQADQWKAYHSAWQTYYQKYYEGFYEQQKQAEKQQGSKRSFGSHLAELDPVIPEETLSKEEALEDLRHQLLRKVRTSATKVRKSRHFIPITAAIFVVLVFVFLQYNSLITGVVMAYVSPGTMDAQNIDINPSDTTAVNSSPTLIIPKINVDVPMIMGVQPDYNDLMAAMQKGVTQFSIPGANSVPGQIGNFVVAGHSSNDLFDPGDYKFIFSQLTKMQVGDTFYADYQGTRYTYVVTKTQVVSPTDVSALVYPTDKPIMTLITCTPLGTSWNRLLVVGQQIDPAPSTAKPAPASSSTSSSSTIPGASAPSVLQKLFGAQG